MRTAKRRHNDEKKLKQRIKMCNTRSWRGIGYLDLPQDAINKMKNGHRSGWRYHSCRCDWCMEGKLTKQKRGNHIADWEEGQDYKHLLPVRHKLYYCEEIDVGAKWLFK